MGCIQLEESPAKSEVLLGCKVQANLKWNLHIEMVITKLGKRISGFAQLRYICPLKVKKFVTEGIFNGVITYCLPLFGGKGSGLVKDIKKLQNKAARMVCNAPLTSHRKDLYVKLDWMTVNQLLVYHSILTVFKIRSQKDPEYLATWLCKDSRNGRIMIPRTNLSLANDSFCFRGPCMWNLLPKEMRSLHKLEVFRKKLRSWVIGIVSQFLDCRQNIIKLFSYLHNYLTIKAL